VLRYVVVVLTLRINKVQYLYAEYQKTVLRMPYMANVLLVNRVLF